MAICVRSKSIRSFALHARLFVALIQICFNYLIPDHDAKVFNPPIIHATNAVDNAVTFLLGGFRRWDAVYFLHVAEYGYTYENALAFFPLFPLLTRVTANTVLLPLQFFMNYSSSLLVSAFFVNLVLFVLSADILYRLGIRVVNSDAIAYKAAQLYCVNPASVFFSAPYSETTFAFFTFAGMFMLESGRLSLSSVLFGASSLARSNGLVNCAFIWYKILKDFQTAVYCRRWQNPFIFVTQMVAALFISLGKAAMISLLCWSPFLAYQYYAYRIFCNPLASYKDMPTHILNYGNNQKYKMPHTGLSTWCHQSVPVSYSYVQQNHWNVGFLNYYEWKQFPNFLLAMPMMCLCAYTTVYYVMWNPLYSLSLGLYDPDVRNHKKTDDAAHLTTVTFGINKKSCFVYIVHMASLTVFGVLFMHIQVLTRFIASSCPIIYWFVASITMSEEDVQLSVKSEATTNDVPVNESNGSSTCADTKDQADVDYPWNENSWLSRAVLIYFHLYLFVGVAAFSNFLPWT